jgi:hypothetical protein
VEKYNRVGEATGDDMAHAHLTVGTLGFGPGISVGIATGYGLDSPGTESR